MKRILFTLPLLFLLFRPVNVKAAVSEQITNSSFNTLYPTLDDLYKGFIDKDFENQGLVPFMRYSESNQGFVLYVFDSSGTFLFSRSYFRSAVISDSVMFIWRFQVTGSTSSTLTSIPPDSGNYYSASRFISNFGSFFESDVGSGVGNAVQLFEGSLRKYFLIFGAAFCILLMRR